MSKKDRDGILLIIGSILVIALVFGFVGSLDKKGFYDETTLCPLDSSFASNVVIIDKSDRWKNNDAKKIVKFLNKLVNGLDVNEQLILTILHENTSGKAVSEILFNLCNPGNEANPLYENPRMVFEKYKKEFKKPLDKIVKLLTTSGTANRTPLLQSISDSLNETSGTTVELFIISDLFENTPDYDFYESTPSPSKVIEEFGFKEFNIVKLDIKYIDRGNLLMDNVKVFFRSLSDEIGAPFEVKTFIKIK